MLTLGVCRVITAFAKEQKKDNGEDLFVQDRLWENKDLIWKMLSEQKAHLYVCGHLRMGQGVENMLAKIVQHKSPYHSNFEDAKQWLQNNIFHATPSRCHWDVFA